MEARIFRTNTSIYQIEKTEQGTLTIVRAYNYYGGKWCRISEPEPILNAGMFINQQGGVEALWEKSEQVADIDAEMERVNAILAADQAQKKARHEQMVKDMEQKINDDYHRLFDGKEVVETTAETVYVLLRYLNTRNWGGWELPRMTIGYQCNQYDCDGKTATTIKLDSPIEVCGEPGTMFQTGASVGHLRKYRRIANC